MPIGIAIDRQLIMVLEDGTFLLDWENGLGVDLLKSEFVPYRESDYSHAIQDEELEILRRAGRVAGFDHRQVYVISLPEVPRRTEA